MSFQLFLLNYSGLARSADYAISQEMQCSKAQKISLFYPSAHSYDSSRDQQISGGPEALLAFHKAYRPASVIGCKFQMHEGSVFWLCGDDLFSQLLYNLIFVYIFVVFFNSVLPPRVIVEMWSYIN